MMSRIVAIVGRPNVGKSRLFNRLARKRISIVHDQPGITRDVISAEIAEGGYTLLDTGGLGYKGDDTPAALTKASEQQVRFRDRGGLADPLRGRWSERTHARSTKKSRQMLRKSKKKVRLVVNKADFDDAKVALDEAYRLGLGEPLRVSAEHGTGEAGSARAPSWKRWGRRRSPTNRRHTKTADDPLCICFIGRPNVGKSSLSNRLLQERSADRERGARAPRATRSSCRSTFIGRDGKKYPFRLIDTAGIKAATKLASPVEYFSRLRSLDAIKNTDVVFLVLDAIDGVDAAGQGDRGRSDQGGQADRHRRQQMGPRAGGVQEAGRISSPYKSERDYREKYEHALFERLVFHAGFPGDFCFRGERLRSRSDAEFRGEAEPHAR